jgi:16S rRNA C1402 (ribose-2'-O) methylase RsmI
MFLATNLTTADQKYWRGSARKILKELGEKRKREFVLIIDSVERL